MGEEIIFPTLLAIHTVNLRLVHEGINYLLHLIMREGSEWVNRQAIKIRRICISVVISHGLMSCAGWFSQRLSFSLA